MHLHRGAFSFHEVIMNQAKYQLLPVYGENGKVLVMLTSAPFEGVVVKYGVVKLTEDGEVLRVRYDYEVLSKKWKTWFKKRRLEELLNEVIFEIMDKCYNDDTGMLRDILGDD